MLATSSQETDTSCDATEEASLVRRARKGDQNAFALLYNRHAKAVHALAWRLTSDRALAEDITQESFLRMLRHIRGIDPDRPVRPWLKQVAARIAIDKLRRRWRDQSEESIPEPVSPKSLPDAYGEALGLLQHLPPQARALVWLNQMEGWTHMELGNRFGQSESWSKSIVSRAISQLREHVSEVHRHDD